jgi:chemotaxis protein CheY-P-specific phosphatase CheC
MALIHSQAEAITEIVKLGIDLAANSLVELVRDEVKVRLPSIVVLPHKEMTAWLYPDPHSSSSGLMPSASITFHGAIQGNLALLFSIQSATQLASALGVEPTAAGLKEVVAETGSIVLNAVAGSMANCLGYDLTFDTPRYCDGPELSGHHDPNAPILLAHACFELAESTIEGEILLDLNAASTAALTAAHDSSAVR